jgi:DNA-binding response OmpR family regulator
MSPAPRTVLIVEDEANIASFVAMYLQRAGYRALVATTGQEGLQLLDQSKPQLVVLDLMLPDIDGVEVCRQIRSRSSRVPVLMLTARDDPADKVTGLEIGADDYLTKPFNPRELVARVQAILRRAEAPASAGPVLRHADVELEPASRIVRAHGEPVALTPKEFDLLESLLEHRGLVLSREQLLEQVWGYRYFGDSRTVDVHVRQLRRKLADACPITTVWGAGYRIEREA